MVGSRLGQVRFGYVMLHSHVTDMAARVTPTIQIPQPPPPCAVKDGEMASAGEG